MPSSGGAVRAYVRNGALLPVASDAKVSDKITPQTSGGLAVFSNGRSGGLIDHNGAFVPIGRVEKSVGGVFCDWQTSTGTLAMVSTDANDDVALDTAVTLDGLPTVKTTFSDAATGTYIAGFTFTNAVSLKNFRTISVPVKITSLLTAGNVGITAAPFQIWLMLTGGKSIRMQCDFANIPPGGWHVFTFSRSSPAGLVSFGGGASWADLDSITIASVRIVQGTVTASNSYPVWVGGLRVDARTTGHVSIVMDGEYISQYTLIRPLLDRHQFKTSLAIVNSNIGASSDYMTLANIDRMYDEGHECIHHTYDGTKGNGYVNASDWASSAVIADDINQQWEYFRDQGWDRGIGKAVNAFANCFVEGTATARQQLIQSAFRMAGVECSRASVGLYTTQMQLGYKPPGSYHHLRGAVQISNTSTAADITTIIDQAEFDGTWAIITVHRAVASSPGSLEMTTANFETWLEYLATRVAAGGVSVAPMGEVYDRFYR